MREVTVKTMSAAGLAVEASAGGHTVIADEPVANGGADSGLAPHELLLGSLGACTAITLRLYAQRKGWPLRDARVAVAGQTVNGEFVITSSVELLGDLDDAQRTRLLEIAGRCPVHRTLSGTIRIETREGVRS